MKYVGTLLASAHSSYAEIQRYANGYNEWSMYGHLLNWLFRDSKNGEAVGARNHLTVLLT